MNNQFYAAVLTENQINVLLNLLDKHVKDNGISVIVEAYMLYNSLTQVSKVEVEENKREDCNV